MNTVKNLMFGFVLLAFGLFLGIFFSFNASAEYTGFSDYRLVRFEHQSSIFNPNQNVLVPTAEEKAIEEAMEKFLGAAVKSTIPIMNSFSGKEDLFNSLMSSAQIFRSTLQKSLQNVKGKGPYVQSFFLIPWQENQKDKFYSNNKVAINDAGMMDVIRSGGNQSEFFETTLTDNIKGAKKKGKKPAILGLQKKLYSQGTDPLFLLASEAFVYVEPKGKSSLTVRVMVGLNPMVTKLDPPQVNDQVVLDHVTVPDIGDRGAVGVLTINIPLGNQNTKPTLHVRFGDFVEYKAGGRMKIGNFIVKDRKIFSESAPCLTGRPATKETDSDSKDIKTEINNRLVAKRVTLRFCFTELTFDLMSQSLSDLDIMIRPGLKLGPAKFTLGGFKVKAVSKQFQEEINNTIKSEIDKSKQKAAKSVGGVLESATMKKAMALVFGAAQ